MPTVKQMNYPKTFSAFKKNAALLTAFGHFAEASSNREHASYLRYCTGKYQIPQRYEMFHGPNAQYKIKIGPGLQKQLDALAQSKRRENQSEMKKIYQVLRKSCEGVLTGKSLPAFYKSEYLADAHFQNVLKTGGNQKQARGKWLIMASKKLNLKKPKNLTILQQISDAMVTGTESQVKALCEQLASSGIGGSIGMKRDVFKELKKHKLY